MAPTNAKNAKYGVRLNADKETINVVTVVPMLAPIMHAQAWNNVIVPISASLTRVTAVTSEDWASIVCNKPVPADTNLFLPWKPLVKKLSELVEAKTKPFDIKFMPTKKQPHAVKTSIIANNVLKIDDINELPYLERVILVFLPSLLVVVKVVLLLF